MFETNNAFGTFDSLDGSNGVFNVQSLPATKTLTPFAWSPPTLVPLAFPTTTFQSVGGGNVAGADARNQALMIAAAVVVALLVLQ